MSDPLSQITDAVLKNTSPYVIAIDGRSGSGKTRLAAQLTAHLTNTLPGRTVMTLHVDDFVAGWHGLDSVVAVIKDLLESLAATGSGVARGWDWQGDRPGELCTVELCDVIIVEGCASGAAALKSYVDLLIWVEVSTATRYCRAIARDGAGYEPWWDIWAAQEDLLYARDQVTERADLVFAAT